MAVRADLCRVNSALPWCQLDLDKYLVERTELINAALKGLLVREDEYPKSLHSAVHYSLFAGGKRLRPVLTLAAAEAVGGTIKDALNAACAIECIHTYSLIHDDLPALDNDDVRRGRPTCHKEFGEAMAILAGDALLTAAFELIGRTDSIRHEDVLRVVCEVARAAGSTGMIGGQVVDIALAEQQARVTVAHDLAGRRDIAGQKDPAAGLGLEVDHGHGFVFRRHHDHVREIDVIRHVVIVDPAREPEIFGESRGL